MYSEPGEQQQDKIFDAMLEKVANANCFGLLTLIGTVQQYSNASGTGTNSDFEKSIGYL